MPLFQWRNKTRINFQVVSQFIVSLANPDNAAKLINIACHRLVDCVIRVGQQFYEEI